MLLISLMRATPPFWMHDRMRDERVGITQPRLRRTQPTLHATLVASSRNAPAQ